MSNYTYTVMPPSTMLCPTPVVLVSCADPKQPDDRNMITLAWAGTVNSEPPMVSISVRKERYSHHLIADSGEFVVNLVDEKMCEAVDFCGVRSGRDVDKFAECRLTAEEATEIDCATVAESPVSIECRVTEIVPLGSHDMFVADIVADRTSVV